MPNRRWELEMDKRLPTEVVVIVEPAKNSGYEGRGAIIPHRDIPAALSSCTV
jgi:hypothetical protein